MKGRRPAELDDPDRQPRYGLAKPYGIADADYGKTYLAPLDSDDEDQAHVRRMVEGEAAMARARFNAERAAAMHAAMRRAWWTDVQWIAVGLLLGEIGVWVWSHVF